MNPFDPLISEISSGASSSHDFVTGKARVTANLVTEDACYSISKEIDKAADIDKTMVELFAQLVRRLVQLSKLES